MPTETLVVFSWISRATGNVLHQEVIAESLAYRLLAHGARLGVGERWIFRVESV